ncbi:hypothetical protein P170DRAFT_439453, partial [Aspergillus steynii IBT 23096]
MKPPGFSTTLPKTLHRISNKRLSMILSSNQGHIQHAKIRGHITLLKNYPCWQLNLSEQGTLRSLCESAITEVPPLGINPAIEDSNGKLKENCGQLDAGSQTTASGKILRPPPGLPMPAVPRMVAEELFSTANYAQTKTRLEEANAWFHKDPRGEKHLRQQVAAIAQNHAERIERLTGTDGTTAKQMSLLLGNVIVNLHSHFS